jgi:excisionase family DNA binding protein
MAVQMTREESRIASNLSRARKLQLPATLTLQEWQAVINHFQGLCAYCKQKPFESLDHLVPVELGGGTTADNCVPACRVCNSRKRTRCLDVSYADMSLEEAVGLIYSDLILANPRRFSYLKRRGNKSKAAAPRQHNFAIPDEIADELRVDQETVLRWLRRKELRGYKLGKMWRVYRADLDKFLEERSNRNAGIEDENNG